MLNEQIKNYLLQEKIGEGGMATVYKAQHKDLRSIVAVKVLKLDFVHNRDIRSRFLDEPRKMARLQHPNIVRVTDMIDAGDVVAFVMEYVEGETLKQYLDRKGKLTDEEIKNIFEQMLDAVDFVHDNQLIHRDIKPSNFMIDRNGKVKLMDFGIAKTTDETAAEYTQTGTGVQMGTPMYMSPEQVKSTKAVTHLSDIYSLGVVLWQMVSGRKPYDSKTLSTIEMQINIIQHPLPLLHNKWDEVIQKATDKEEKQRYQGCVEILSDTNNSRKLPEQQFNTSSQSSIKSSDEDFEVVKEKQANTINTVTPPKKHTNLALWVMLTFFGFIIVYFLFKESNFSKNITEQETNYQHVLIASLKIRNAPDIKGKELFTIYQSDSINLLNEEKWVTHKEFQFKWVKCQYKNKNGWVATEIDGQQNLGSRELAQSFKTLLTNEPSGNKFEFQELRTIVFHGIVEFLKEKGLDGKYSFVKHRLNQELKTIHKFDFVNENKAYSCWILLQPKERELYPLYLVVKFDFISASNKKLEIKEIYGWKMKKGAYYFYVYDNRYVDIYDWDKEYLGTHADCKVEEL